MRERALKVEEFEVQPPCRRIKEFLSLRFSGEGILSLNLCSLEDTLRSKFSQYKIKRIKKILPCKVLVEVKLKKPLFQIYRKGSYWEVLEDFKIGERIKKGPHPGLPLVRGFDFSGPKQKLLKEFFRILDLQDFPFKIKYIDIYSLVNFSFYIEKGPKVILGYKDLEKNLKRCQTILVRIDKNDLAFLDLRFQDPITSFKK